LDVYVLDIDAKRLGRCFDRFDGRPMDCIAGVPNNGDTAEGGNHFLKKLEPLGSDLREKEGCPREVTARASEIGHETGRYRVARDGHNDGYRGCRLFRRSGRRGSFCDDNIDLEPDQVGSEGREPIVVAVGVSVFDGDVPALDIAEGAQRLPKDRDIGRDKRFGTADE
jgi:hypothetical protein